MFATLDPHELVSWVNQIDGHSATFGYFRTHELVSWVNQIDGHSAHYLLLQDPHELARG